MKRLLLLSAIVATALAFGACGSDDDAAPPPPAPTVSFPFTDGDGIPELREFPNFSPSIVSRGSNVTVDVHVDSDTTDVQVDLGMFDSVLNQTFLTIFSGVRSVTPGAVNGITIMVPLARLRERTWPKLIPAWTASVWGEPASVDSMFPLPSTRYSIWPPPPSS